MGFSKNTCDREQTGGVVVARGERGARWVKRIKKYKFPVIK